MRKLVLYLAGLSLATAGPVAEPQVSAAMPDGPQGPPGARLVADLVGKLQPRSFRKGAFNNELEEYVPEACQR